MSPSDLIAAEMRLFWCASSELRQAYEGGAPAEDIAFHLFEIETIRMHTELPVLRQRCQDILDLAALTCPDCSFFRERRNVVA